MSVKFFGQFLLLEGIITLEQLRRCIDLMDSTHQTLGHLAVEQSLMTEEDAHALNREQLQRDLPFGKLAIDKGLLNEQQLEDILALQSQKRLRLGEALVRLEIIDQEKVDELLQKFRADQAPFTDTAGGLPAEVTDHIVANFVVDLLPKLSMRVARMHLKVAHKGAVSPDASLEHNAAIEIKGDDGVALAITADSEFANRLMQGMVRIMSGSPDSPLEHHTDYDDILGELLDIIAGQIMSNFEQDGKHFDVSPPGHGALPATGQLFELVSPAGHASLVLQML